MINYDKNSTKLVLAITIIWNEVFGIVYSKNLVFNNVSDYYTYYFHYADELKPRGYGVIQTKGISPP